MKSINLEFPAIADEGSSDELGFDIHQMEQELVRVVRAYRGAAKLSVTIPFQKKGRLTLDMNATLSPTDKALAQLSQFGKVQLDRDVPRDQSEQRTV